MGTIRLLLTYWKSGWDSAKESRETLLNIATGIVGLGFTVWQFLEWPLPAMLESNFAFWIGVVAFLWGFFHLFILGPAKRHKALEDELAELKRKRKARHELAMLLERLEKEIARIQSVPTQEWIAKQGNPAAVVAEVIQALDKHVGPGESELLLSQIDQIRTPIKQPTTRVDQIREIILGTAQIKQDWIDSLTHYARHLKRIVEEMRQPITD